MTNQPPATAQRSESAVTAVIDDVQAAWTAHDPDAFVERYEADATATLLGSHLPDREAIRATMTEVFAGPLKGSRGFSDIQRVRFLNDDVAVVHSIGSIAPAGYGEPSAETRSRETWILSRRDDGWRVAAYQSTPERAV